jgi:hypothetical protein
MWAPAAHCAPCVARVFDQRETSVAVDSAQIALIRSGSIFTDPGSTITCPVE